MMRHILIIILAFIAMSITASATVLHVPSEYATIRAGINASVNGDTMLIENVKYAVAGVRNGFDAVYFVGHLKGLGSAAIGACKYNPLNATYAVANGISSAAAERIDIKYMVNNYEFLCSSNAVSDSDLMPNNN